MVLLLLIILWCYCYWLYYGVIVIDYIMVLLFPFEQYDMFYLLIDNANWMKYVLFSININ